MLDINNLPALVSVKWWPKFTKEKAKLDRIDDWYRWKHDRPHQPQQATSEYRELVARAQTPYLQLVVTAVAQQLFVEGYRRAKDPEDATPWTYWQANGMDARQTAVHRAALAFGSSYVTVMPGTNRGEPMPVIRGVSPRRMLAFYADPAEDDWPEVALRADPNMKGGWNIRVYDEINVYHLTADSSGGGVTWQKTMQHDAGVCPVIRFANMLDLEGRSDGEVEPLIPLAGRIDQTVFDRLVVQRFASWVVRTIAGMEQIQTAADPKKPTAEEIAAATLKLKVSDILVAPDADTKFGSLPATPLDGFISAHASDLKDLAAVSQTPPHNLIGEMINLSAEALAAAETGASRKKMERQHSFGESWEQVLRLGASIMGDEAAATDMLAQVRWRDVESRSLAQAADALGKLAQMLGVPVELLWEKIPGWTQQDVERAKDLAKQQGGIDLMMQTLLDNTTPPSPAPGPTSVPAVA